MAQESVFFILWRLRRATRFESETVREAAIRNNSSDNAKENDEILMALVSKLHLLDEAEKELRDSRTLSRRVYEQVAPLLERDQHNRTQSEKEAKPVQTELDHDLFLTCIINRKRSLNSMCKSLTNIEEKRSEAIFDCNVLLPEDDMERVIRYEERMHRQIDWAVQRVLEAQERRKTLQFSSDDKPLRADG